MVRLMNKHLLSLFREVTNIEELDIIWGNTDILNEISHFTVSGFIQISEDTIFELRIINLAVIVSNFLVDGNFEGSLISKNIL